MNWWRFSIDPEKRRERIKDSPTEGTAEVNPELDGKRLISYHSYLGLDDLLSCQVPSSLVPDERVFIITHQLFEIVFKQIIFDLRVIADTFRALLAKNDKELLELLGTDMTEAFWRPAVTASSRVRHSTLHLIPGIMTYLATDQMFDNEEFQYGFRDNLSPASGFQSAQFRLIQRAFGKSPVIKIRLFPADPYLKNYNGMNEEETRNLALESEHAGLLGVADPLILREDAEVATPPEDSPLFPVTELDDLAHELLMRIGAAAPAVESPIQLLPDDGAAIAAMEARFTERLKGAVENIKKRNSQSVELTKEDSVMIERRGKVFRKDWTEAIATENRRRKGFTDACKGGRCLFEKREKSFLKSVLEELIESDKALSEGFLLFHQKVVERRIGNVPGTAGGGVPYLDFSRELIGYFPGLIALNTIKYPGKG